jgi:hypothetical protein
MNTVTVINVNKNGITFSNGQSLSSEHQADCCESHELSFENLSSKDFEGMTFDLNGDFFERVADFGIRLKPVNGGHPVSIPGYGYNNGYYGDNIELVISGGGLPEKRFDITECQVISG